MKFDKLKKVAEPLSALACQDFNRRNKIEDCYAQGSLFFKSINQAIQILLAKIVAVVFDNDGMEEPDKCTLRAFLSLLFS